MQTCISVQKLARKRIMQTCISVQKLARKRIMQTCISMQKLALLGPAVCSQNIIVHFVNGVRTNERPSTHPARITSFQLRYSNDVTKWARPKYMATHRSNCHVDR